MDRLQLLHGIELEGRLTQTKGAAVEEVRWKRSFPTLYIATNVSAPEVDEAECSMGVPRCHIQY